jgi:hypothetical protein
VVGEAHLVHEQVHAVMVTEREPEQVGELVALLRE